MGLSWFITNPVVGYIVKSSEAETQPLVYKVLKVTLHFKAGLQSFCKSKSSSLPLRPCKDIFVHLKGHFQSQNVGGY